MTASTDDSQTQAAKHPAQPEALPWTCPFCSLLCDDFAIAKASIDSGQGLQLVGSDCPRARAGLTHFGAPAAAGQARIDGAASSTAAALDAAAEVLAQARQPLFGGLVTEVSGMRALYQLANECGAILDHAHGDSLMHSLRALQDRGLFYTTLAEIRNRADLIVCLGTDPRRHYPEFFRRCTPAAGSALQREVVFLATNEAEQALPPEAGSSEQVAADGNLFEIVSQLAAQLAGRRLPAGDETLGKLAERMRAASYCVIVWEPGALPRHGALIGEAVLRMVNTLNRKSRAAAFCLTGSDGAYTANYVSTWLSGLPLRTGVFARGLEHDPERYASARLIEGKAVDALLWVASFGPEPAPPASTLPTVVLGHPALGAAIKADARTIFLPVATPGIDSAGHLFRADGGVVVPLAPLREDGLPTVAQTVAELQARIAARAAGEGGK